MSACCVLVSLIAAVVSRGDVFKSKCETRCTPEERRETLFKITKAVEFLPPSKCRIGTKTQAAPMPGFPVGRL